MMETTMKTVRRIFAFVGGVDAAGEPQIYTTHDVVEAEQGLMRVAVRARNAQSGADRARSQLMEKWRRSRRAPAR